MVLKLMSSLLLLMMSMHMAVIVSAVCASMESSE
jgi:hypothetical protein